MIITTNVAWSARAVASLQQHGHGGWHASRVPLVNCSSTVESGLSTEPGVYDGVVCRRDQEDDQPTRQIDLPTERHVCSRQCVQQAAQLSQRDRSTFCVVEYFAKSLKITQGHSKWHPSVGVKQYGHPPIFSCMCRPRSGTRVCYIYYSLNYWHLLVASRALLAMQNGFTVNWVKGTSLMMTSSNDSQWQEILHARENFELGYVLRDEWLKSHVCVVTGKIRSMW